MKRLILYLIPYIILNIIRKKRLKNKYDLIIPKRFKIDNSSYFEGRNAVNDNTEVTGSFLGFGTYIACNSIIRKAKIGRFCSIGDNVRTHLGIHPINFVSLHPAFYSTNMQAGFTFTNEQLFEEHKYVDKNQKFVVQIGNDVWIGNNVQIMDGITIGDGAVLAAGSIITKNVEPYSIVGGIPAKTIKFRFNPEQIEYLLMLKWWEKDYKWISENVSFFKNIEDLVKNI